VIPDPGWFEMLAVAMQSLGLTQQQLVDRVEAIQTLRGGEIQTRWALTQAIHRMLASRVKGAKVPLDLASDVAQALDLPEPVILTKNRTAHRLCELASRVAEERPDLAERTESLLRAMLSNPPITKI
jgi:hypothetical protein